MLTVGPAFAQSADSDALRRLQEENAALRRRLAEVEGKAQPAQPAAAQSASTSTAPAARPSIAAEPADKDTLILSPFVVKEDKDFGYLKTNSATATKIGTEIQKVPLSISVISEDFIKDTGMKDIQDVLRYQASSAGDTKMGILQPGTSFTPSGAFTTRGFPINSRLRNGILRYNAYNLDNVERVEVIKGPAAVFFGGAFPGGVINYVTKQPSFSKIPTNITYSYGGYDTRIGSERATLDHNEVLSDKAAIRIVGAWDHGIGDERFEFQNGFSFNAGLTLVPLKSGKLRIAIEGEKLARQRNQDDFSWQLPDQYFKDYANPPAALIAISGVADAAAYRARILSAAGTWIADVRNAANDQTIPLWTQALQRGAYYTDKAGNRIHDEKFNYYGQGSYQDEEVSNFGITTDLAAFSWLDVRHNYTSYQTRYNRVFSAALPLADGIRFNQLGQVAATMQGYDQDAYYHQLDLVFKKAMANFDNKLLVGGLYGKSYASFTGSNNLGRGTFPYYGSLPGAFDKPDEGYVSPIPENLRAQAAPIGSTNAGARYDLEFLRNRAGTIITPQQIFSEYDPGIHVSPDIRRIAIVDRALVDHSRPTRKEWYLNWQGTTLNDRLTIFAGYRHESQSTLGVGQIVSANPPWFTVEDNALVNIPEALWPVYGLSAVFSRPRETIGTSKMGGFSYELTKNVNVYASYSQTFLPPGVQYQGGDTNPVDITTRALLLGKDPVAEMTRINGQGFFTENVNEKGKNIEFGVKVATEDNKLVGTLSVYRVQRLNRTIDDPTKQVNEPLNYLANGTFNRVLRWFSNSADQQTEGVEFEGVWSPVRNFQSVVSGSWMWQAKTLRDPSLEPNSTTSALAQQQAGIVKALVLSNRIPFAPEYRFNVFNKYTFTENFIGEHGRGLSLGLGLRYASEIVIANDLNTNSQKGGLTAGDYVVFQTNISYPFELLGYKMSGTLNVDNLTNKDYSEGGFNLSPPRSYTFTIGMKF
jgi:outer membrane receptor protein involved in Fe transport